MSCFLGAKFGAISESAGLIGIIDLKVRIPGKHREIVWVTRRDSNKTDADDILLQMNKSRRCLRNI